MAVETKKVGRLRRLLEPLAVLYEEAVLKSRKEPFEVTLRVRQSTDHQRDNYHVSDTIHIIDGETLQAVHEVWQEFRLLERALLEQDD